MTSAYQIAISQNFFRDFGDAMLNPALRTRLHRFSKTMESPFAAGLQAEKLVGALYSNRYSLRLSDSHRAIFDQVGETIIFRALDRHDESYKRAERLPIPDLTHAIPFANIYSKRGRGGERNSSIDSTEKIDYPEVGGLSSARLTGSTAAAEEAVAWEEGDSDNTIRAAGSETAWATSGSEVLTSEQYLIVSKGDELLTALGGRMAEWMLFLPEEHRRYVTMRSKGPSRIFGPSGTGKTCILLHKAVFWAKEPDASVLVLTFRPTLVKVIARLRDSLCLADPSTASKIRVASVIEIASELLGVSSEISTAVKSKMISSTTRSLTG